MSSEELNRRSYREADTGETYETAPRINSSHTRITYSRLEQIADNLNFNSSIFAGMLKRNRSLGSAQAFIVELALADRRFMEENVLPFCIGDGINMVLDTHYMDTLYFDRLAAYHAKRKKLQTRAVEAPKESSPIPAKTQKRSYFLGGQ